MTLLTRLAACIAGVDHIHRQQNGTEIRAHCEHVAMLVERAVVLLDQAEADGDRPRVAGLRRWAGRIAERLDPEALLACDPRVEQSLDDLVALLEDEAASR